MKVYGYDNNNYYTALDDDYGGPMPHNCTTVAPPALPWGKKWPQLVGKKWKMIEDHRVRRVEDGFAAGLVQEATEYWLPSDGDGWQSSPRTMSAIGPLPVGAVLERPVKPQAELDKERRAELQSRLAELDAKSARPLRALAAGTATDEDRAMLADLETQAASLRVAVAALPSAEAAA